MQPSRPENKTNAKLTSVVVSVLFFPAGTRMVRCDLFGLKEGGGEAQIGISCEELSLVLSPGAVVFLLLPLKLSSIDVRVFLTLTIICCQ